MSNVIYALKRRDGESNKHQSNRSTNQKLKGSRKTKATDQGIEMKKIKNTRTSIRRLSEKKTPRTLGI